MSKPIVKVVCKTVGTRTFFNLVVSVDGMEFPIQVCYGKDPSFKATQFLTSLVMKNSYAYEMVSENTEAVLTEE